VPDKVVTITATVGLEYDPGDYAKLCWNGGSGDVDYDEPVDDTKIKLFGDNGGFYGFGEGPFGEYEFGDVYAPGVPGFGESPFGDYAFGYGSITISATKKISDCGDYKFGFAVYDSLGNLHSGVPGEVSLAVHVVPDKPKGLSKVSYDKNTDILVLGVRSNAQRGF